MGGQKSADHVRSRRLLLLVAFDCFVWLSALVGFAVLGLDFAHRDIVIPWTATLLLALGAALLHFILGWVVRPHHGRARLASLDEMILLGTVAVSTGFILSAANALGGYGLPSAVPIAATFIALVVMAGGRVVYRRVEEPMVETELVAVRRQSAHRSRQGAH